ncbi:MAG: porin, partial [Magnetococcus sp. YQC-5]
FPHTTLKLGNHKAPFSMDEVTTSRWATFMETSLVTDTFKPGRRLGFSVTHWENSYYFGTGIFGDDPTVKTQDDGSERFAWSARGAYRPYLSSDARRMVHVGANYLSLYPDRVDGNAFSYSSRPEAHFVDYKFVNTGDIEKVEKVSTWGLEAAGKWDKFYTQAEYLRSKVNTEAGAAKPNPEFSGWYAMVAYFLTDDERPYNLEDAEFGPVVPNGRWGGLELALRYSVLDLNDIAAGVLGGEEKNITVGLNWYVNNNFILRGNYIRVNNDQYANKKGKGVGNDDVNIYGMRAEYLF